MSLCIISNLRQDGEGLQGACIRCSHIVWWLSLDIRPCMARLQQKASSDFVDDIWRPSSRRISGSKRDFRLKGVRGCDANSLRLELVGAAERKPLVAPQHTSLSWHLGATERKALTPMTEERRADGTDFLLFPLHLSYLTKSLKLAAYCKKNLLFYKEEGGGSQSQIHASSSSLGDPPEGKGARLPLSSSLVLQLLFR